MATLRYPSLEQINTRAWLTEMSRRLGRAATLDDIPDVELHPVRYETGKPKTVEPVRVVTEYLAEEFSIIAFKLLSLEAG
jgi:hypothetical protein